MARYLLDETKRISNNINAGKVSDLLFYLSFLSVIFLPFAVLLILSFIFPSVVLAGISDGSKDNYESRLIAHDVTPDFVWSLEKKSGEPVEVAANIGKFRSLERKTIFWKGRVTHFLNYPENFWMRLDLGEEKNCWVYAKKSIRNLDFDRTGFRVGVKGNLVLESGKLKYVKARSVVLLEPPPELTYVNFVRRYRLLESAQVKTSAGTLTINDKYYPFVLHRIYIHNPNYSWSDIQKIGAGIIYYSRKYKVDPLLTLALLNIESAFDIDAVSVSGAMGLGQLMPGTAAGLGVNARDPVDNVAGAVKYLERQLYRWKNCPNSIDLALASYNAGPGAVSCNGGIPPFSETRNYVFFINYLYRTEYKKQLEEKEHASEDLTK